MYDYFMNLPIKLYMNQATIQNCYFIGSSFGLSKKNIEVDYIFIDHTHIFSLKILLMLKNYVRCLKDIKKCPKYFGFCCF